MKFKKQTILTCMLATIVPALYAAQNNRSKQSQYELDMALALSASMASAKKPASSRPTWINPENERKVSAAQRQQESEDKELQAALQASTQLQEQRRQQESKEQRDLAEVMARSQREHKERQADKTEQEKRQQVLNEHFVHSAARGDLASVKMYLAQGAQIDALILDDRRHSVALLETALMWAAYSGHAPVVQYLIEQGADINIREATDGYTAFMNAAMGGSVECMALLLSAGANMHAKLWNASNALHLAIDRGQPRAVEFLLHHGAHVNEKGHAGKTSLMFALNIHWSSETKFYIIRTLLAKNPDLTLVNEKGENIFDMTRDAGVLQVLNEHRQAQQRENAPIAHALASEAFTEITGNKGDPAKIIMEYYGDDAPYQLADEYPLPGAQADQPQPAAAPAHAVHPQPNLFAHMPLADLQRIQARALALRAVLLDLIERHGLRY